MPVNLAHKQGGTLGKPPLVILHGLLGSSRNWTAVVGDLSSYFDIYTLDARNHGASPHTDGMDYEAMVGDAVAWLDRYTSGPVTWLGHSMGGKVGMALACRYPEYVERLIVADIAPKDNRAMSKEFEAMEALDVKACTRRADAEEAMKATIPDLGLRRFLLTNLERAPEGGFCWSINLPVLAQSLASLAANSLEENEQYEGPTLFIRGGQSPFIQDSDKPQMDKHFLNYQLITLLEAGHNVHVDDRPGFVKAVMEFAAG